VFDYGAKSGGRGFEEFRIGGVQEVRYEFRKDRGNEGRWKDGSCMAAEGAEEFGGELFHIKR